ncbi:TonB-dependent receptor [Rudanella paleaurantiibacter]|uniref:TonB-dependent receptor n=1 Tax=Rudanella paleaurantiibacter TaxID=2614655 RepID=A0A7J5TTF4_9BACT|nr:outer membrane beta-barrel family protein [Rudanella paleaurantiibacter]KAB7727038.1 TonB-dependent receptor [Rudanella paleaurantiibacter]
MKNLYLLLLVGCLGSSVFAQTPVSVRGTLVDEQNAPVPFTTVALHRSADSTLVAGATANEAGTFAIPASTGQYYLKISSVAYLSKVISPVRVTNADVQIGTVVLKTSAQRLAEVVVQGEKSQMELALDKKIFNVGKDLANAGGTAIDVMRNIPSVAVDVEGNISLRGSGSVRILIDGKPSGLVSFKGGAGLQQLQGSQIERVEVITNPSARYEAEGMGGVINIVLKKERQEGFNSSVDLITGYPANLGVATNLNYRKKNLNFFVNYTIAYRRRPGRNSLYQEVYRNDSTLISQQNGDFRQRVMNNNIQAGIDYFFNERNILTGSYTYRGSKGKRYADIYYRDFVNSTANPLGVTYRTQDETETEPNSEYAITYKRSFLRKGHELSADIRLLDNWESSDQLFTQQLFKPDGRTPAIPLNRQRSVNDEGEKQLLLQIDYVHPFAKQGKFEAGVRSSDRDMTNDYSVTQQNNAGVYVPLPGLTNNFVYEEKINALYGIVGNKNGRLSYQAGVRAEWTDVKTTLKQTNEVNPRAYANLFPSVHMTYDLPRQHALQISYSRRVRRPTYNDLSPFMTFSDARNFFSGNPDLNPEFTDAYELGHIKYFEKGSISSSAYYRYTTGKILRIRRVDAQGMATTRPENLATENAYGIEFAGSYALAKWWKLDGNFNFFRAMTDGANLDSDFQSDTYAWFTRLSSRFTVVKGTDLQLRGNYDAPQQLPQGRQKALAALDLAVSREIFNKNGTMTLNVIDVFNSRKYRSITEGANFYTSSIGQGRLRQINLTISYRFRQATKKKGGFELEQ